MKISLGSSRVAMKLLLKILLQCCLPVDGSSAGRGGSAQAARADGVGRAGAQRRARGPRSHACHRSHGGRRGCAAAPGKTPTPPPPNTHTHTHPSPSSAAPGGLGMRGGRGGGEIRRFWGLWESPRGGLRARRRSRRQGCAQRGRGEAQPGLQRKSHPLLSLVFLALFGVDYASSLGEKKKKGKTATTSSGPRGVGWDRGPAPVWV